MLEYSRVELVAYDVKGFGDVAASEKQGLLLRLATVFHAALAEAYFKQWAITQDNAQKLM